MSYKCFATGEVVKGERCILIPTKIRKVIYIAQTKPDPRSDFLQFVGQWEGWEIVKEVPVRESSADWFVATNEPVVVGIKEVFFMSSGKKNIKFNEKDELDKPNSI